MGGVIPCSFRRGFDFYKAIKSLGDFNENYLPYAFYYPYIVNGLNNRTHKSTLSHKSLTELLFNGKCKFPKTLVRTVGGVLLDEKYNPLTFEDTEKIIIKSEKNLLLKPSFGSSQGRGIKLFRESQEKDSLIQDIKEISQNGVDFVIQEMMEQSEDTRIFNPTSLNCMRLTTLNLNGEISVCSQAIKCGPPNSIVDNIGTGKNGVMVGLDFDGNLYPKGFYGNGEQTTTHNGVIFSGCNIRDSKKILQTVKELHSTVETCKVIGWDIALDSNNEPVLIESNVIAPGITFEQLCTGPIFGSRTDEVIEFIKNANYSKKM